MPFKDPIVAGTTLIRAAIRSPDYVPGVSGWSINRDGSVEFNDATLRGELLVTDPDGSYVRIYDENPGAGAVIELNPADQVGETYFPAEINAQSDSLGEASLAIQGPQMQGVGVTRPQLWLETVRDTPSYSNILLLSTRIEWNFDQLGFEIEGNEGINNGAAFVTTSATFVSVTGAPTVTLIKRAPGTRVRIDHTMTAEGSAAGTGWETALLINGTDYRTGRMIIGPAAIAGQPLFTAGTRVVSGIPAGTYLVTPRLRRYAGAGNVTWQAGASYCSLTVAEVIE